MNEKERKAEKERLMKEVLGKNRSSSSTDSQRITLTTGDHSSDDVIHASTTSTSDLLKQADEAFDSLKSILGNQQKDLNQMSAENGISAEEMEQMNRQIEKDYDLKPQVDSSSAFENIEKTLNENIIGQKDALHALTAAFRRPYVMGREAGKPANVIVISGPEGSGRHTSLIEMAEAMKKEGLISSDEVSRVDMSLYTSAGQEQIFLQDLYRDLNSGSSILCFENFEASFAPFLRMLDELAVNGKVHLSKRYVLNKGMLIENQTGLVKNTVDSLSAEGKYLVFITENDRSSVQNAFGADFLYHVLDEIKFVPFSREDALEYVRRCCRQLQSRISEHLKLTAEIDDSLATWVVDNYDKSLGAEAINALFDDFYISISQQALETTLPSDTPVMLRVENDTPVAVIGAKPVTLTRSKTSSQEIEEINKELDEIVGLEPIKEYIRSLQSHVQINELRRQQGKKVSEVSRHMIFTGNPGTGKTTIARLLARYMKAIGALSQGQLVEVSRADLVAQYVGQTAPLTMSVIKSALGGVLFIDEAYSLYRGKDDSFGLESIDTIVKAMEDNRDNLIVILAGYKKEMAGFLEANSGLRSRFPNVIDFPDYTGEELGEIASIQAKSKGYYIDDDAMKQLVAYFDKVQSVNAAEAGNGRLARNTVESAILKQNDRLVKDRNAKLDELRAEDFDFTVKVKPAHQDDAMF